MLGEQVTTNLSVLVVAFNPRTEDLQRCLDSVLREERVANQEWQVLLLDNASGDRTYLGEIDRRVGVLLEDVNLGFGRAVNRLVAQSSGEYCLLLNPDAELDQGAGAAIAEIIRDGSPETLYVGRLHKGTRLQIDAYWHWWSAVEHRLRQRYWRERLMRVGPGQTISVAKACGGALLARTELLRKLGPFSEGYFLYGEDADLSLRARQGGADIRYVYDIGVTHLAAASMDSHSALVERARADAAIRLSADHLGYFPSILVRADLLITTLIGIAVGAASSRNRRDRSARLQEIRRWGVRRTRARFDPHE